MVDREFMQLDEKQMWQLKNILEIEDESCYYCDETIEEGDKFSIFNKPTRLICGNIICLSQAIGEDEDEEDSAVYRGPELKG